MLDGSHVIEGRGKGVLGFTQKKAQTLKGCEAPTSATQDTKHMYTWAMARVQSLLICP